MDLLIDAYAKICPNYPDSELTIIGNGPEMENLQYQAENLGLTGRVVFVGAIYDPFTLGQYMHESLFMSWRVWEGYQLMRLCAILCL